MPHAQAGRTSLCQYIHVSLPQTSINQLVTDVYVTRSCQLGQSGMAFIEKLEIL
jgi:hypothetical protein